MTSSIQLALAQVTGGPVPEENLDTAAALAETAARNRGDCIVFPEMFMALPESSESLADTAEPLDGPFCSALGRIARENRLFVAAGVWEKIPDKRRVYNTAVVLSPDGRVVTAYRKLHLFDALSVRESDRMVAGDKLPSLFGLKGFRVGLAICYDLRFPELFRHLAGSGADLILVPSAWYAGPAKETHWLTLLRARAIENTAYMAGVNLTGPTFSGASAIFDPFGILKAGAGEAPELIFARIDADRIREVREKLPALEHRRTDLW